MIPGTSPIDGDIAHYNPKGLWALRGMGQTKMTISSLFE